MSKVKIVAITLEAIEIENRPRDIGHRLPAHAKLQMTYSQELYAITPFCT